VSAKATPIGRNGQYAAPYPGQLVGVRGEIWEGRQKRAGGVQAAPDIDESTLRVGFGIVEGEACVKASRGVKDGGAEIQASLG
jgi:hypothetical protein